MIASKSLQTPEVSGSVRPDRIAVLHAIPTLTGGGAERQLALLAREQAATGMRVHVAYCHPGVNLALLDGSPVSLHPMAFSTNHDPVLLVRMVSLIRSIRPDIVQTWLLQMDVFGGMGAQICRVPHVLSERASAAAYESGWKNALRRIVGLRAAAIVANSQTGLAYWGERSGQVRRVVRNGLASSPDRHTAMEFAAEGIPPDSRILLYAGRFVEQKNMLVMLDAMVLALRRHPDVVCVLFGEGPLRGVIEARAQSSAVADRILIRGYTNMLSSWMVSADAFVSVSHFEGTPNVVMEAISLNCPLVLSDIPEHREIVDEEMALICDHRTASSVAAALSEVLDKPQAAALRASRARERAASWSLDQAVREYSKVYDLVLRKARRRQW